MDDYSDGSMASGSEELYDEGDMGGASDAEEDIVMPRADQACAYKVRSRAGHRERPAFLSRSMPVAGGTCVGPSPSGRWLSSCFGQDIGKIVYERGILPPSTF